MRPARRPRCAARRPEPGIRRRRQLDAAAALRRGGGHPGRGSAGGAGCTAPAATATTARWQPVVAGFAGRPRPAMAVLPHGRLRPLVSLPAPQRAPRRHWSRSPGTEKVLILRGSLFGSVPLLAVAGGGLPGATLAAGGGLAFWFSGGNITRGPDLALTSTGASSRGTIFSVPSPAPGGPAPWHWRRAAPARSWSARYRP